MPSATDPSGYRLRAHQQEALDAVIAAAAQGGRRWWVTMPPGAGKTVLGVAVARWSRRRTVAFGPNTAIAVQWADTWQRHGGRAGLDRDLSEEFTALTYQALATFEPESGEEGRGVQQLHENGRALVDRLRSAGPLLIILDESHHLIDVWGELLREVLDSLPEAMVLGLTATPPAALSPAQRELTDALVGTLVHQVRTPLLVTRGQLAPYLDLAWLVTPTAAEQTWLDEQQLRWTELQTELTDPDYGSTSLLGWCDQRIADGRWPDLHRGDPDLADALLRLHYVGLLSRPVGAVVQERHREDPDSADWVRLIDDWLRHCIRPGSAHDRRDAAVLADLRRVLPTIDHVLTRNGIRRGIGQVDRVLARSRAKMASAVDILATESAERPESIRALVLCDFERAGATSEARLGSSEVDTDAGSARAVLSALRADPVTATLHPLLVTGRTVAGDVEVLTALVATVASEDPAMAQRLRIVDDTLVGPASWTSGHWVRAATRLHATGPCRVLIGTRGLLGEGWDAPAVSTLIDLTTATTATAVTQIRGRALRLDPADPAKTAVVWSPVAVHPTHPTGGSDWQRLVRKHRGHHTLDQRGKVVDGVAGVDPTFSPFHPPPSAEFEEINARMLVRAGDRTATRRAWEAIDSPQDVLRATVRISPARRPASTPQTTAAQSPSRPEPVDRRLALSAGQWLGPWVLLVAVVAAAGLLGHLLDGAAPVAAAGSLLVALPAALALIGRRRLQRAAGRPPTLADHAAVVADTQFALGESPVDAAGVVGAVLPDGSLSFQLDCADETACRDFAEALAELVSPLDDPRYLISRPVVDPVRGPSLSRSWRSIVTPAPTGTAWHRVPSAFANRADRVAILEAAWRHWVGPGSALWVGSPAGAGVAVATRGSDPMSATCVLREEWC